MNIISRFLSSNSKQIITSIVATIITTPIVVIITLWLSSPSKKDFYEDHKNDSRPYLSIVGDVEIDSIVCWHDSLKLVEQFQLLNLIDSSKTLHKVIPYLRIYYSLNVVNKGSGIAVRVAEAAIDSFNHDQLLREFVYTKEMIVEEPKDLFPWYNLPTRDTAEIKFEQTIHRERRIDNKGYIYLHVILFYENEYGNLYDTYYKYQLGFNYPHYLITSRRGIFRKLDPAPLRYVTYETWRKNSTEDSKIYSFDEATEFNRRINYYYQKLRKDIEFVRGVR